MVLSIVTSHKNELAWVLFGSTWAVALILRVAEFWFKKSCGNLVQTFYGSGPLVCVKSQRPLKEQNGVFQLHECNLQFSADPAEHCCKLKHRHAFTSVFQILLQNWKFYHLMLFLALPKLMLTIAPESLFDDVALRSLTTGTRAFLPTLFRRRCNEVLDHCTILDLSRRKWYWGLFEMQLRLDARLLLLVCTKAFHFNNQAVWSQALALIWQFGSLNGHILTVVNCSSLCRKVLLRSFLSNTIAPLNEFRRNNICRFKGLQSWPF